MDVIEPTIDYDFSNLYLGPPSTLTGGAYFTRLMQNNNKSLYIQSPKSLTKQGFIKNGKKIYTDLMFDNNDTVFINWIENLENTCQNLIFNKGQNWFENKLEIDDIESAFTSPFKIFKSGKFYLLRVNVKQNIKIYDEKDQIINIDDINSDKSIISILEIQGIKFTSRNFQIEIELKQCMIVSPDPFLDECFIKNPNKKSIPQQKELEKEEDEEQKEEEKEDDEKDLEEEKEDDEKDLEEHKEYHEQKDLEENIESEFIDNNNNNNNDVIIKEDESITLDIEELTPEIEYPDTLKEIDISSSIENNLETFTLKKHNQVYYEIYQKAREKAKEAKKNAILAFLEMKNIKKTYMLDDMNDSDSDLDDLNSEDNPSDSEN
uniref:Uncharacterized protein n=1 Tax=viral metagenome TaxID=1070528 RepID=A0A6C0KQL4_9ZZZZ